MKRVPLKKTRGVVALLALFSCGAPRRTAPEGAAPPTPERRADVDDGAASRAASPDVDVVSIGFGGRELRANVLLDPVSRARGFMGRAEIGHDEALLFVYATKDARSFWMRSCLTPIDILFLDDDGVVQGVSTATPVSAEVSDDDVPRHRSPYPTRLVLETKGGGAAAAGVGVGSKVALPPHLSELFKKAAP
jgi:uncharacterized membrane protein (UPF0127 family)